MNRLIFIGLLAALISAPVVAQEVPDMTPNVLVWIYDGHDPNRDYKNGDIVDIQDGWIQNPVTGVWRLRNPYLPQNGAYMVRIWGVTKAQCQFLIQTDAGNKRPWQLLPQLVPMNIRTYFNGHGWVGFGTDGTLTADDISAVEAAYGTQNDGDFVLWWATVRTWLYNKTTKTTA